jgi:hypothetical protein
MSNKVSGKYRSNSCMQEVFSQECATEETRKLARQLYEKSGKLPGHDLDNWLKAEKEVRTRVRGGLAC